MKRQIQFSVLAAVLILLTIATQVPASTINGIANQIISGITQYGVVVGGGSGDLATVSPSSTSGYPLISQGTSSNPTFAQLPNGGLANSSITFGSSGCITASGSAALGSTFTLTNTCTGFTGTTNGSSGASPTWTLANGDLSLTLSANATITVTVATSDKFTPHSIQVCQPGSGGPYTLTWPSNVKGGMTVGTTASKCSMQSFESYDGTNLYATATGILNQ